MTIEEALYYLDTIPTIGEQVDALEMAIKALEQQPCEDCISRQAVLEGIAEWVADGYADSEADISHISSLVTHLPSATPKEKTGWIPVSERLPEECGYYLCSLYYAIPPYHIFHPENDLYIHDVSVQKFDGKSFIASVKAWMPLPEPYKAESEDKEVEHETDN